jgi:hypothetical protein
MAESFAGQSFKVLISGFGRSRAALISVRPIPGGDRSYVDASGRQLPELQTMLLFDDFAAYQAFEALLDTSGTLVLQTEGSMTALLKEVALTAHHTGGKVTCAANWLVLA